MIVYKFGGAVARSRRGLEALVRVTTSAYQTEFARKRGRGRKEPDYQNGIVLVVSAIGHTTRYLSRAAELAELPNLPQAEELLDRTIAQYKQLATTLGLDEDEHLSDEFDSIASDVRGLLEGIAITRELSPRIRDAVISNGEHLTGTLVQALLRDRELPVRLVDARDVIITNEQFGHAAPLFNEIRVERFVVPRLKRSEIVLIQGFIGATRDGIATTMGSESSDLTATLLSAALDADEVVIWKTLPGIFSADPEIVPNAKILRSLSFEEAEEIGRRGARILFPTFAHPFLGEDCKTILRIATPFARSVRHTALSRDISNIVPVQKALALALEQHLIPIKLVRKNAGEKIPQLTVKHRQKLERLQAAMNSALAQWSTPSETVLLLHKEDKAALLNESDSNIYSFIEQSPVSALSVIIRKQKDDTANTQVVTQIARSLRAFHVHAILPIEQSIVVIVDDKEAVDAMKKLHHDLFERS